MSLLWTQPAPPPQSYISIDLALPIFSRSNSVGVWPRRVTITEMISLFYLLQENLGSKICFYWYLAVAKVFPPLQGLHFFYLHKTERSNLPISIVSVSRLPWSPVSSWLQVPRKWQMWLAMIHSLFHYSSQLPWWSTGCRTLAWQAVHSARAQCTFQPCLLLPGWAGLNYRSFALQFSPFWNMCYSGIALRIVLQGNQGVSCIMCARHIIGPRKF